MTDLSYVAPPPPPPPPPARPAGSGYDFLKPFTFLFQDPRWVQKVLVGGLFYIAAMFLVGIFFILGYLGRLARNVAAGVSDPAPEWDDLGEYFAEGVTLACVAFVYVLPLMFAACALIVPAILAGTLSDHMTPNHMGGAAAVTNALASGTLTCGFGLLMPLGLLYSFWVPAALLFAANERRFGAGFEFGRIARFIRTNIANYVLAFVIFLIARFAMAFGLILFCIGVFFTGFWALAVATYAFAEVYRLAPSK